MRVGRSALTVFAANGVNLVLSLGSSILLTRTLGVVGRGEFAVFSASFGVLSLMLGLGLDVSIRYFVARNEVPRERILTSVVGLAVVAGVAVFVLAQATHLLGTQELLLPAPYQHPLFEAVLAGVVAGNVAFAMISSVFAGARSFQRMNLVTLVLAVLNLMVWGTLLWAKETGVAAVDAGTVFMATLALQWFAVALLLGLGYRSLGVRFSLRFIDVALLRAMVRYAGASFGANLAQFLNYRVDIWIVQALLGTAALGLYALAANLAMMLWLLPRSTSTVLLLSLIHI